jgi:hypothetical protein
MSDTRADAPTPDTHDDDAAPDISIYLDDAGLSVESDMDPDALFDLLMEAAHAVGLAALVRARGRTN